MNALRNWRKQNNLTLEEASAALAVSVGSLSRIERGEQWPDRSFFERLAKATSGEVTANDFLPDQRSLKRRGAAA